MEKPGSRGKDLLRTLYAPPKGTKPWTLNSLVGHDRVRYFRLGRHALRNALASAKIQKGEKILLPGLICREVADAIRPLGAVPVYYPVNERLELSVAANDLPEARALVTVNYFGFPQDLQAFGQYRERTGAVLVEDNAHGLFSRDTEGRVLGTRGDLAIFSFRKTLPIWDGAALVINSQSWSGELMDQLPFNGPAEPTLFKMKQMLRALVPLVGVAPPRYATRLVRSLRPSPPDSRSPTDGEPGEVPIEEQAPSACTLSRLSHADPASEIARRRSLYQWIDALLSHTTCRPVFRNLPKGVAPYGFPFYMGEADVPGVRRYLGAEGFNCFPWPDLPAEVGSDAPPHYKNLWCVQFLW